MRVWIENLNGGSPFKVPNKVRPWWEGKRLLERGRIAEFKLKDII